MGEAALGRTAFKCAEVSVTVAKGLLMCVLEDSDPDWRAMLARLASELAVGAVKRLVTLLIRFTDSADAAVAALLRVPREDTLDDAPLLLTPIEDMDVMLL